MILLVLPLAGCGVIFGGSTQQVSVTSTPSQARLTTEPLTGTFATPATLTLERKKSYTLVVWSEGYRESQFPIQRRVRVWPLVGDILLGLVPIVVDAVTGGLWALEPVEAAVTLQPVEDGLPPIEVRVTPADGAERAVTVEATAPVQVRLVPDGK